MLRDDRLHAFIVAHTTRPRARIRHIHIRQRWLKLAASVLCLVFCTALYGLYGAFREAAHLRVEQENQRLRAVNEQQRRQLDHLNSRVEAVEDASRRLAEISGVTAAQETTTQAAASIGGGHGTGGPLMRLDAAGVAAVEARAAQLEAQLRAYEDALRERNRVPSLWPVAGELTDSFGARRDPFGGTASEFHAGQDIAAQRGTPVVAAGNGTVTFAGTQNGYGQVVIVDHGGGLTTRYGHLSRLEVAPGQPLRRGELLGRVGSTGRSTGPHLHYEVRVGEEPVNPRAYLP